MLLLVFCSLARAACNSGGVLEVGRGGGGRVGGVDSVMVHYYVLIKWPVGRPCRVATVLCRRVLIPVSAI